MTFTRLFINWQSLLVTRAPLVSAPSYPDRIGRRRIGVLKGAPNGFVYLY